MVLLIRNALALLRAEIVPYRESDTGSQGGTGSLVLMEKVGSVLLSPSKYSAANLNFTEIK